ncbi:MAG: penicillin acylase family protein [Candidatus Hermodarchaeota archaeon]|nr:penicillin acylase family protein [Candidatus Hermodarchaeota archaeon]
MSSQRKVFSCKNVTIILVASLILGMMVSIAPWLQPNGGLWQDIHWANLPPYATNELPGLDGEIHIVRDYWGVPHIFASSLNDLYLGCGYAHAQDRLFQLDLFRRIAEGKLAEVFGDEYIELDLTNRQLGLGQAANASLAILAPQILELLESYAEGINLYMHTIGTKIPMEFRVLNYFPGPWNVTNTLAIERYLAWQISASNTFQDLNMASLINEYGASAVFTDLFPETHYNDIPIVPPGSQPQPLTENLLEAAYALAQNYQRIQALNPIPIAPNGGSNSWVINGSHTATGAPILCNDPHMTLTTPAQWYEVHLIGPGHNVQGITYPGIPFVYQGHNPGISWGWSGMVSDVSDFYYYIWRPGQPNQYWYHNDWHTIVQENTTIWSMAGGIFTPTVVTLNSTVHGPLFEQPTGRFALKWTGANGSLALEALFDIAQAADYSSFVSAIEQIECPNLNFIYADTSGNIAYHAAAAQPIRAPGLGPSPLNGSSGTEEWAGFIPFNELPHSLNPDSGFLVAANNRPVNGSYPYYLGYDFAPAHRANRITDLLNTSTSYTLTDMQHIQLDSLSLHALAIKDIIASVVLAEVSASEDPLIHEAATILQNWDGIMEIESIGATIWAYFSLTFLNATFFDEYSAAGSPDGPYPSVTVLENFTQTNYPLWFDDILTPSTETRDDIILSSFEATIESLASSLGEDISIWYYFRIHALWAPHPLGETYPYMNSPAIAINGSEYTVNYAPGFIVAVGSSYRMIIDLDNFQNSLSVLPGGQRANVYSNHYLDQLGLWLVGEYHPLPFPSNLIAMTEFESITHLVPADGS